MRKLNFRQWLQNRNSQEDPFAAETQRLVPGVQIQIGDQTQKPEPTETTTQKNGYYNRVRQHQLVAFLQTLRSPISYLFTLLAVGGLIFLLQRQAPSIFLEITGTCIGLGLLWNFIRWWNWYCT